MTDKHNYAITRIGCLLAGMSNGPSADAEPFIDFVRALLPASPPQDATAPTLEELRHITFWVQKFMEFGNHQDCCAIYQPMRTNCDCGFKALYCTAEKVADSILSAGFRRGAAPQDTTAGTPTPEPEPEATGIIRLTRKEVFELMEYSESLPAGLTFGKRWKRWSDNGWMMGEYFKVADPKRVGLRWLSIVIIEEVEEVRQRAGTPKEGA